MLAQPRREWLRLALQATLILSSLFGPAWYGLPVNATRITLVKRDWPVPAHLPYLSTDPLVPLRAGESVAWQLQ